MPRKETSNERAIREARQESRTEGYEYRPTDARKSAEAERLNRGLEMLAGDEHEEDFDIDED